jgi:hypothetical protein
MSALPHLASDFFAWLWYTTESSGGHLEIDGREVQIWVDDRIAFRSPSEEATRSVLTGADAPRGAEARAALGGGKVIREFRLRIAWEGREYGVTLVAPSLDMRGLVLPPVAEDVGDGADVLYARMASIEQLWAALGALYERFARVRTSNAWAGEVIPGVQGWLSENA